MITELEKEIGNELYPLIRDILGNADQISDYLDSLEEVPQSIFKQLKNSVQLHALREWMNEGCWGAIIAATGVGKSKIAIDASLWINGNAKLPNEGNPKILILVPTEKLRDENWKEEFVKWGYESLYNDCVRRECYVSAPKIKDEEFDLVIMDEYHNITENNSTFFAQNKVHKVLALSATPPKDEVKMAILADLGIKIDYQIDLDTAVKLRLVAPYEIVIVETRLDSVDKYIKAGNAKNVFFQTEAQRYEYLTKDLQKKQFSTNPRLKELSKWAILARMRFIYGLKSKTEAAKKVLSLIPKDQRVLTFCGGIEQAEELAERSVPVFAVNPSEPLTFHSKSNDEWLTAFKQEQINRLTCVNALNEGQNLNSVDYGVLVQVNSNERNLIQRIGRMIRYKEGHIGKIIILVCTDTQDEVWLKKILGNLDSSKIRYVRYQNLINGTDSI